MRKRQSWTFSPDGFPSPHSGLWRVWSTCTCSFKVIKSFSVTRNPGCVESRRESSLILATGQRKLRTGRPAECLYGRHSSFLLHPKAARWTCQLCERLGRLGMASHQARSRASQEPRVIGLSLKTPNESHQVYQSRFLPVPSPGWGRPSPDDTYFDSNIPASIHIHFLIKGKYK